MAKSRRAYRVALAAYFGLLLLLWVWHVWLVPPRHWPTALVLAVLLLPLAAPLRGLLHGRPYTFAWTTFLALFYFLHGISEAVGNPPARAYAVLEILLSLTLFVAAMLYARWRSRGLRHDAEAGQDTDAVPPPLP
jgi:uncharacterized membrane protein